MGFRVTQGDCTFDVGDGVERLVRAALDRAAPGVLARVEAHVGATAQAARAIWPVKTGRSKEGLEVTTIVSDDSVRARVYNRVPYAFFVRPKALGGKATAWNTYVRIPIRATAKRLADEIIAPGIVEDLGASTGGGR